MSRAVRIQHLSKRYRLRHDRGVLYRTFRDEIVDAATAPLRWLRGQRRSSEEFWALQDLNFEVSAGEIVGVIGRNGAGKSTLLKILSRITKPTTGRVEMRGKVGSLLEVGTGFHPELTGRENIFLSGAVLGMKRAEIARRFDEIVAFAEVERFLDLPVKRYSSGMYMRLAFSVPAHLEPDILIIDEVLAVGDAAFQKKCLGKVRDLAGKQRTVLFVSHNLTAVQSLCDQAVWLDQGVVQCSGPASDVTGRYLNALRENSCRREWPRPDSAPGNDVVRLHAVSAVGAGAAAGERITVGDRVRVEFAYWLLADDAIINPSVVIYNQDGVAVCNTYPPPTHDLEALRCPAGLYRASFEIPGQCLNDGSYDVQLYIIRDGFACATASTAWCSSRSTTTRANAPVGSASTWVSCGPYSPGRSSASRGRRSAARPRTASPRSFTRRLKHDENLAVRATGAAGHRSGDRAARAIVVCPDRPPPTATIFTALQTALRLRHGALAGLDQCRLVACLESGRRVVGRPRTPFRCRPAVASAFFMSISWSTCRWPTGSGSFAIATACSRRGGSSGSQCPT